jgi:hypothetical protein
LTNHDVVPLLPNDPHRKPEDEHTVSFTYTGIEGSGSRQYVLIVGKESTANSFSWGTSILIGITHTSMSGSGWSIQRCPRAPVPRFELELPGGLIGLRVEPQLQDVVSRHHVAVPSVSTFGEADSDP